MLIVEDCFKINSKKTIKMPKKGEYIKFNNFGREQKSLILTNIKNMLLVAVVINQYVLMINLVSYLNHTSAKMLFTISFAV